MKFFQFLPSLLSLMMVPSFARNLPPPEPPPVAGATQSAARPPREVDERVPDYPSNVGAVNEGGGSANTNGMNNGLTPNASGSGTNSMRAEHAQDESGISFGGTGKSTEDTHKGNVQPEK